MAQRLNEPWQASWYPENMSPASEALPELPGTFPSGSRTEIYELPLPAVDKISMSDDGLSNLTSPFQETPLEYVEYRQEGKLGFVPLQEKQDRESVLDTKVSNTSSTSPERVGTSTVSETGKSTKTSVKDSLSSKLRKGSKTATTPLSNNNIVIAVFGLTGSGKSTFISKLTGKDVEIGHGLQSCEQIFPIHPQFGSELTCHGTGTSEIEEVHCKIGQYNVTLVDTPGFDDTNCTDTEILTLIASWMKDAYDDKTKLTGIIYLHRISDNKMSGSSYKNLKMFRSLCGTKNLSHVILATTMWDKVGAEEGGAREAELLSENEWWGQMKSNGSMVRRYDDTAEGAMTMVNELLRMPPVVLTIQDEIAVQKKLLIETVAGRSINEYLEVLNRKHEEDLAEVKTDLALAIEESKFTVPINLHFVFVLAFSPIAKSNANKTCAVPQKTMRSRRSSKP